MKRMKKKSVKKSLFISSKEVKKVMLAHKAIIIAYLKKNLKNESMVDSSTCLDPLVKEYQDVFQEPPKGLPPLRGIEHQIDFILGASLPNRLVYRTNPINPLHSSCRKPYFKWRVPFQFTP